MLREVLVRNLLRRSDDRSVTDNCPRGCDCSCCYGYTDKSCHCFADPCNCGGNRAEHGQKPLRSREVHEDQCPECGTQLTEKWSGVECAKCGYVFCY